MTHDRSVQFENINVINIDTNSGVFIGENKQWNWHSKTTTTTAITINGQRNVVGKNMIIHISIS